MIEAISHVKEKPTRNHRMALWESITGTIFAMDDNNVIQIFGRNLKLAKKHSKINIKKDIRYSAFIPDLTNVRHNGPKVGQMVLWVEK